MELVENYKIKKSWVETRESRKPVRREDGIIGFDFYIWSIQ